MLELITQRKLERARFSVAIAEWQTQNLGALLVGLAQDSKQAKAMSKMVEKMRLPLADEADSIVDKRSAKEIHEQGAKINLDSQPSFEALTQALGGPQ